MSRVSRSLDGIGRITGHDHPELGPNIYDLTCDQCGAGWAGQDGEPCGWCAETLERMIAEQAEMDRKNGRKVDTNGDGLEETNLPTQIDWHELYRRETEIEWLVEDFWPIGRQLQIFAARKTGKSLVMLWIAANLAVGRDPFTGIKRPPSEVSYLDHEMTPDDVLERVEQMGFTADQLAGHLHYYLLPLMPPLDTEPGGARLMRLVERDRSEIVVIDTLSRVVKGEENSNDTYMDFYAHTGRLLKRAGVALARLDHEGHEGGRARGASSKADDVDINWRLRRTDDGIAFDNKGARIGYVAQTIDLRRGDDPLRFQRIDGSWPEGTKAKADELDKVGVPLDASQRKARELLVAAGMIAGTNTVLAKALSYRKMGALSDSESDSNHSESPFRITSPNHLSVMPSTRANHSPNHSESPLEAGGASGGVLTPESPSPNPEGTKPVDNFKGPF